MQRFGQFRFGPILLLSLVLVLAIMAYQAIIEEPKYEGRTVTAWLILAENGHQNGKTLPQEAIRALGPKALPVLLKMLQAQDPPVTNRIAYMQEHLSNDDEERPPAARLRQRACFGFEILGPAAEPAIPKITRLLANTNISAHAARALGSIGPEAAPSLVLALTNANAMARLWAVLNLGKIDSYVPGAIPGLLQCFKDPDWRVRINAPCALSQLQQQPERVVPELMALLKDPFGAIRYQAANTLGKLGANAKPAVPAITELLEDPQESVRTMATNALSMIEGAGGN